MAMRTLPPSPLSPFQPTRVSEKIIGPTNDQIQSYLCSICHWSCSIDGGEADIVLLDDGRIKAVEVQQ